MFGTICPRTVDIYQYTATTDKRIENGGETALTPHLIKTIVPHIAVGIYTYPVATDICIDTKSGTEHECPAHQARSGWSYPLRTDKDIGQGISRSYVPATVTSVSEMSWTWASTPSMR